MLDRPELGVLGSLGFCFERIRDGLFYLKGKANYNLN